MTESGNRLVNLDVLALAFLCCLLAAVVGVLVLGDPPAPPPPPGALGQGSSPATPPTASSPVSLDELRREGRHLRDRANEVVSLRTSLLVKLERGAAELGRKDLETRIEESERKLALVSQLEQAEEETVRIQAEVLETTERRDAGGHLGDYHGPFVLLECVEGSAIVYPGKTRIDMEAGADRLVPLVAQISEAGFVALAVRPSGWYSDSFDKLRERIYKMLDEAERKGGKHVGRTTFPLEAHEPIDSYLSGK